MQSGSTWEHFVDQVFEYSFVPRLCPTKSIWNRVSIHSQQLGERKGQYPGAILDNVAKIGDQNVGKVTIFQYKLTQTTVDHDMLGTRA